MGNVSQIKGLARLRRLAGLTQAELAERAGIRQQRVAEWERGVHLPRPAAQRQLAEALGVTPAQVFEAIEESARLPGDRENVYSPDQPFRNAA